MLAGSVTTRTSSGRRSISARVLDSRSRYSDSAKAGIRGSSWASCGEQVRADLARDLDLGQVNVLVGAVGLRRVARPEEDAGDAGALDQEAGVAGRPPGAHAVPEAGAAHRAEDVDHQRMI